MPPIFERIIDLEGRLRLPDFLFDEYRTCIVSLGVTSRHFIQIMPSGVYMGFWEALEGWSPETPLLFNQEVADISDRLATSAKLKMDEVGRIKIPMNILNESEISPGSAVIGKASFLPTPEMIEGKPKPSYWRLYDKLRWLQENPSGQYTLDYYSPV